MSIGINYRELDKRINEIRLLRLLPPSASDPDESIVQCVPEDVSLADPPPYTALSYYRGDVGDKLPIRLGGDTFFATRSLPNALRNLCVRSVERVWADAICINQFDIHEKADQITRIGTIY